jgi:hypothetical protein
MVAFNPGRRVGAASAGRTGEIVEVRSKDEAIELARRLRTIVGDGESVIQQVFGPDPRFAG